MYMCTYSITSGNGQDPIEIIKVIKMNLPVDGGLGDCGVGVLTSERL